jgi:hypothetical protein
VEDGQLILDIDGEQIELKESEFELEERYVLEGEEGKLLQTENFVLVVEEGR